MWITTDAASATDAFSPHARILTRITGTGTPDGGGTNFTFIDPLTGREATEPFADFITAFEQMVSDNKGALFLQIVHFADASAAEGGAKGAVLKAVGGKALEKSLDVLGEQLTKALGPGRGT